MRGITWPAVGRKLVACGCAVVVVAVAGCGGSGGSTAALSTGSSASAKVSSAAVPQVTWAFNASLQALNISTNPDNTSISLLANVLQGLLAYDAGGSLHPSLASSWHVVSPVVYTYTFRSGVRFSDGHPVRLADVLYSMRRAMNPKTGGAASSFYQSVKSIDQVGTNQIKVTLRHPDPGWKYTPGHYSGWVYEKAAAIRAGSSFGGPRGIPIGSGPYKIAQIVPGDHVTFVRNSYYSGPRPKVARVVVRFIGDDATRLAAIQSGDIDGTFLVPLQDTPQWKQVSSINLLSAPSSNNSFVFFNVTRKPFDDVHVRRALMYAFNRAAVVHSVLHDNARVATTLVPPELWVNEGLTAAQVDARSSELGMNYPYDMAKAKAELAASNYPHGFSTSVVYTSDSAEVGTGLQVLAQSLQQLNVHLKLHLLSDAAFGNLFVPHPDFTLLAGPGSGDYPDPLNQMGEVYCSCQAPPNGFNVSGYKNPVEDRLITEATANPDTASRVTQIMQGLAIGARDLPFAALWWDNAVAAVSKKLVLTNYGIWTLLTPWMANIGAAASQ